LSCGFSPARRDVTVSSPVVLETAMNIKLVIADVDGTLVTKNKVLTPGTCAAVDRLRQAGIQFTITSGRPPRGMASLVAPLKLTAPVAAFNGGMYVKADLKTVLVQHTIPPLVARQVVDYLRKAGLDVWVYQGIDWFITRLDAPRVARERSNVGFDPIVIDTVDKVLDAPIKIVGVSEDRDLVMRCEAELAARLGADATAARSTPAYLDVTHPEANKGMVVREASRLLHLPLEQIATIGDMANDIPMLTIAGLGIAMGNGGPDVQRVARHVTRSNEDEGFAYAVESFILGEPPIATTRLGLPPRARACLFGLEGVLTQAARIHAEAWKQLFDHYLLQRARASNQPFIPFDPVHEYAAHFGGGMPADNVRSFLVARGIELPASTIRALVDRKGEILSELLGHEHVETYEGSLRYVEAVRNAGLRTAVVSTSKHGRETLVSAGIAGLFDACVESPPVRGTDGDGEERLFDLYLAAARALGVDAEDAVVFDDGPAGIEAGRVGHLGYVVAVDRLGRAADLRRHGADVVVPDLAVLLPPGQPGDAYGVGAAAP
jgi:Cof subfamily protein (haloacid dehalogenase superfamily)